MKRHLFTGLLIWIPVAITVWVFSVLISVLDGTLGLLPEAWQPENWLGYSVPGLGVLLTLLVLWATGLLAANIFGKWFFGWWNRLLQRIPIFNTIYNSIKQVSDTLLSSNGQAFRQAVLVPYPHPEVWSIGFVTGDLPDESQAQVDGPSVAVYVPAALNPTTGFVVWVPEKNIRPSGMTVDEALKYVVSMGVVSPSQGTVEKTK